MPSKRIARSKVWAALGALVALAAALVLLVVYVIAPAFGKHPSTPQPTLLTIHPADPSDSIIASAVAPDGSLWFTEERFLSNSVEGPAKIGHVTRAGKLAEFPLPATNTIGLSPIAPSSLTVGADGNLWFVEQVGGLLHTALPRTAVATIDPAGTITEYALPFASSLFFQPSATTPLALGPDGTLWFGVDVATHLGTTPGGFASVNELARITPAGAIMGVPLTNLPASKTFLVDGSLTFGPDGNLWTNLDEQASSGAITAHDIAHITPAGAVTLYTLPSAGAAPVGYVVGADGNLWFIEYPANAQLPAKIARITPAGQLTEYALPTEAGGLFPSLTRNGDSMWFVDEQASCSGNTCQIVHSQIGRITMSGTITTYPVPSSSQVYYLNNGPDGNLYFVEMTRTTSQPAVGNDRLGRITPSGQIVEYTVPMYHLGRFNLLAGSGNTLWLAGAPAQGQTGASFITRITLPHG